MAGISGKYPQVSGVSIPQISSYIHVTPHLCARGALNSVTQQYPDILIDEDLKYSLDINYKSPTHRLVQTFLFDFAWEQIFQNNFTQSKPT